MLCDAYHVNIQLGMVECVCHTGFFSPLIIILFDFHFLALLGISSIRPSSNPSHIGNVVSCLHVCTCVTKKTKELPIRSPIITP